MGEAAEKTVTDNAEFNFALTSLGTMTREVEMKEQPKLPSPWPAPGAQAKAIGEAAAKQIKQYYQPEHGSLPAPFAPSSRSSWDAALGARGLPVPLAEDMPGAVADVPGAKKGGVQNVPFPHRRVQIPATKQLPVKDGGPFDGIWGKDKKR
jgi:hypothetical protein